MSLMPDTAQTLAVGAAAAGGGVGSGPNPRAQAPSNATADKPTAPTTRALLS